MDATKDLTKLFKTCWLSSFLQREICEMTCWTHASMHTIHQFMSRTSFTPFEVMFARKAVPPIDAEMDIASPYINDEAEPLGSVIERLSEQRLKTLTMVKECIHRAQKKQKDAYDRKHALSNSYVIGDLVLKKDFKRKKELEENWMHSVLDLTS